MLRCSGCLLDVSFVVDHSSSIGRADWTRILNFMSSVAASVNVGPSGTHVGSVSFGV